MGLDNKLDNTDILLKAAALCKEAAQKLRAGISPEKQASEVVDAMVDRNLINSSDAVRYQQYFTSNPEKVATAKAGINVMPTKTSDLGEVGSPFGKTASTRDPFDDFINS